MSNSPVPCWEEDYEKVEYEKISNPIVPSAWEDEDVNQGDGN